MGFPMPVISLENFARILRNLGCVGGAQPIYKHKFTKPITAISKPTSSPLHKVKLTPFPPPTAPGHATKDKTGCAGPAFILVKSCHHYFPSESLH